MSDPGNQNSGQETRSVEEMKSSTTLLSSSQFQLRSGGKKTHSLSEFQSATNEKIRNKKSAGEKVAATLDTAFRLEQQTHGPATRALKELELKNSLLSSSKKSGAMKALSLKSSVSPLCNERTYSNKKNPDALDMTLLLNSLETSIDTTSSSSCPSFPSIEWEFYEDKKYGYDYFDASLMGFVPPNEEDRRETREAQQAGEPSREDHILRSTEETKQSGLLFSKYELFRYTNLDLLDIGTFLG